jgi:hypothetical protein
MTHITAPERAALSRAFDLTVQREPRNERHFAIDAVPRFDGLAQRAARNYPDSEYLQSEWRRAVAVVRSTSRGWHLDRPVPRTQGAQR